MGTEENKALVRRLVDAQNAEWAGGAAIDRAEFFTPDRRYRTETVEGREAAARSHIAWTGAHHTIEQLIGEDNVVIAVHRVSARHSGDYWGIPATGRIVEFEAVFIHRFRDGKIAETVRFAHDIRRILAIGGTVGVPGRTTPV